MASVSELLGPILFTRTIPWVSQQSKGPCAVKTCCICGINSTASVRIVSFAVTPWETSLAQLLSTRWLAVSVSVAFTPGQPAGPDIARRW